MIRINGSFVQILAQWLAQQSPLADEFYQEILIYSSRNTISQEQWKTLLNRTARIYPMEDLGMRIGSLINLKSAGVLGYLVLSSESLSEALLNFVYGEHHFYKYDFAQLTYDETTIHLSWPDRLGQENALFVQLALSACYTFFRTYFSENCRVLQVDLGGRPLKNPSTVERFFGCPVTFCSSSPGLIFCRQLAEQKLIEIRPEPFRDLQAEQSAAFEQAIIRIGQSDLETQFVKDLQHALLKQIPQGKHSLAQIAPLIGTSPRTLQRRLSDNQLSYIQLLNGVREQLGKRYLRHSNLSLSEIALLLGYSEQSSFNRAFKFWTGQTPVTFRQN